jgi:hypothetical protein
MIFIAIFYQLFILKSVGEGCARLCKAVHPNQLIDQSHFLLGEAVQGYAPQLLVLTNQILLIYRMVESWGKLECCAKAVHSIIFRGSLKD